MSKQEPLPHIPPADDHSLLGLILQRASAHLSGDELRVLLFQTNRLIKGKEAYGPLDLDSDRRDFSHEKMEEVADFLQYWMMEELKRKQ